MSFYDELSKYDLDKFKALVDSRSASDVEQALSRKGLHTVEDFAALISEEARHHYLKDMVQMAMQLTRRRFGQCINMYLPLYLSNLCNNQCVYCGFSSLNKFKRVVLTLEEIEEECQAMNQMGYENLLLVSGENERRAGMPYFREVLPVVKKYASYLQMEVQPLESEEYAELRELGLDAVSVYQETYHPDFYSKVHLGGRKADYRWRLETPDRLGQAGIDKVGVGALLGLYDWRVDLCALALHVLYLRDHYWQTQISISFPRLRPAQGGFEPTSPVSDAKLLQIVAAWRIFDNELDLTISTRESAEFRDLLLPVGITALSAGSSTAPGGYAHQGAALDQWTVNDARSVDQVVKAMESSGFEAVFHNASTTYFKPLSQAV
ncbi:MAG: 2-iminoacetate synthase ThiH [Succinivibrio sp.]|nr:2-iminoacetate synthase ThiH [Succinivibrio sp.]